MKSKSKRTVAFLVVLTLLASMFTFSVNATSQIEEETQREPAEFSVSTTFSKESGTARIFVDVEKNSQIAAALFRLKFDTSKLKATSVDTGLLLKNGYSSNNINVNGVVLVSYANTTPIYDKGRLFEVSFDVIGEIDSSKSFETIPIELEIVDLKDYDDYDIPFLVNNGKITLINTTYGDVNLSGEITATDSLMVLYAASKLTKLTEAEFICADVNGDNKITPLDALLILRFSAGEISDFTIFNLEKPKNVQIVDKNETYVKFSWEKNNLAIGYNIYMDGTKVNEDIITENNYTVDGLLQDTKHEFEIKSVNTLMESEESFRVTVSTNKADRHVVFKDYDGTVLDTQIVLSGLDAVEPKVPSRKGYTFSGWDKPLTNITENVEITAQYTINQYDVKIDYLDGTDVITIKYDYEALISEPEKHIKDDYTFEGWYQDKTFTKKWDFKADTVQDNMTLYGHWVTWSEWSTSIPAKITEDDYIIESRTEYRTRSKTFTTNSASSLSGWTKYKSEITSWGSWSGWQNSYIASSESRQVNTRWIDPTYKTVWKYERWTNGSWTYYYNPNNSSYSYQNITLDYRLNAIWDSNNSRYRYGSYAGAYGTYLQNHWWNESSAQQQVTAGYTQYQYRDAIYTHHYWKWLDWSDWSTNAVTADDNTGVEERTVYRYILRGE